MSFLYFITHALFFPITKMFINVHILSVYLYFIILKLKYFMEFLLLFNLHISEFEMKKDNF